MYPVSEYKCKGINPQKMLFFIRKKAQKCTKNSMVGFMVGMMVGLMLGMMVGIWRFSVL